ncbi:MAG TPA: nucleotidyltransferase domain-containing protein [Candidatus Pacearchaeota archaeon]|mgnify:FL=1|nr:nucleotidyltransferase domain-containing protein [Candidatus Pacearchaeota archaeon]
MKINANNRDYEGVLQIRTGSHLYGTNTETSDEDFSGIFLPSKYEVFGFETIEEIDNSVVSKDSEGKNTKDAIDFKYYEFRKFCKLALDCNPNILEHLFVNEENVVYISEVGRELLNLKNYFLGKQSIFTKYSSYAKSQGHKMRLKPENYENLKIVLEYLYNYIGTDTIINMSNKEEQVKSRQLLVELATDINEKKMPIEFKDSFIKIGDLNFNKNINIKNTINSIETRISSAGSRKVLWEQFGFDTKFGANLIRLLLEGIELLTDECLTFPLKEKELILDIKQGKYTLDEVLKLSEQLSNKLEIAYACSNLPLKSNYKIIQEFVIDTIQSRIDIGR